MFTAERIQSILLEKIPGCQAEVVDEANDGQHFAAEVSAPAFVGLNRVRQHQIVYQALGDHMRRDIHALALKTYTPDDWLSR